MSQAISRRTLVGMTIGGCGVGVAWSTGLVYSQQVHSPRIDVIGEGESQIVLLDTGRHRVLLALGPGSEWLLSQLDAMIGPFRRSIDICIGSETAFARLRPDRKPTIDGKLWLSVPEPAPNRSPRADRALTDTTSITLSSDVLLTVFPSSNQASGWTALCTRGDVTVGLADRLELFTVPRITAMIAPVGNLRLLARRGNQATLISNSRTFDGFEPTTPTVRTFADEPARIGLERSALSLPSWTEHPGI